MIDKVWYNENQPTIATYQRIERDDRFDPETDFDTYIGDTHMEYGAMDATEY